VRRFLEVMKIILILCLLNARNQRRRHVAEHIQHLNRVIIKCAHEFPHRCLVDRRRGFFLKLGQRSLFRVLLLSAAPSVSTAA
jgi:hypothetical protein